MTYLLSFDACEGSDHTACVSQSIIFRASILPDDMGGTLFTPP